MLHPSHLVRTSTYVTRLLSLGLERLRVSSRGFRSHPPLLALPAGLCLLRRQVRLRRRIAFALVGLLGRLVLQVTALLALRFDLVVRLARLGPGVRCRLDQTTSRRVKLALRHTCQHVIERQAATEAEANDLHKDHECPNLPWRLCRHCQ